MSHMRRTACLSILALMSASAGLADVTGARNPPSFSREEMEIVNKDKRLVYAAGSCARSLRQAFDILADKRPATRAAVEPEPCPLPSDGPGRASDEGALDILKILKEAAGQDSSQ